jgi:hypothetical protein
VDVVIWPKHEADQSPANYLEIVVIFPIQFLWVLQSRAVTVQLYNFTTVPLCNSSLEVSSLNMNLNCRFWPEQRNFLFRLSSQTLVKTTIEFRGCDCKIWSVLQLLDSNNHQYVTDPHEPYQNSLSSGWNFCFVFWRSHIQIWASRPDILTEAYRDLLRPFRKVLLRYFKLRHSLFVLQPFRFSAYQPLYHSTL